MKVWVPTPLRSYTSGSGEVAADGGTVREVLADLDRRYPGVRFRIIDEQDGIRQHIKIFVNADQIHALDRTVATGDELQIICALSGGGDQAIV
jgi:molybdopterin synthase sulfur carrier subunit